MADSYNKKDREKRRKKRKQEKAERKKQRKLEGKTEEFMYVDEDGNLTPTPPDPSKKKEIKVENIHVSTPKSEDTGAKDFTRIGSVKFFNTEKGYGFILDKETQESFFVHADNLSTEIQSNDKVSFEVGSGPKGPIAINVKLM